MIRRLSLGLAAIVVIAIAGAIKQLAIILDRFGDWHMSAAAQIAMKAWPETREELRDL